MNIVIEEIVANPLIQIEETIEEITIAISEMQMPGANGLNGADGKSAYQSALDGGFVGTELEFNTFLSEVDKLDNISGTNTGDETASTIINKIGDGTKINQSYLPSYVDDILEFDTVTSFPLVGELGKIYIVTTGTDINKQYRWTGSLYTQITNGLIASTNDVPEGVNNLYFTTARVLSTLLNGVSFLIGTPIVSADSVLIALGKLQKQISDNLVLIGLKQNTLTNPLTGIGSELDSNTYALQDGTILYHPVKWFIPTSTVSTSGTTVTSVGTQFNSAMIGAKLIINSEWRIITAFTSTTVVTVASAYSVNYSGIAAGNWGVYSKSYDTSLNGSFYGTNGIQFLGGFGNTLNATGLVSGSQFYIQGAQFDLKTEYLIRWSSTSGYNGTKDLGLRRNAAGVLEIYDGITATGLEANRRDLLARNVTATQFRISALNTAPASATATGVLGEIRYDANYMYVCTATNTWKRSALTTW